MRSDVPATPRVAVPGAFRAALLFLAGTALVAPAPAVADPVALDELTAILERGEAAEADVFAPRTWEKAERRAESARMYVDQKRRQRDFDKAVAEAREFAENAIRAAEVGKLSLQQYLDPRARALAAKAPARAADLWGEAESRFLEATAKVESGDVRGGLQKASESAPLFDAAEGAAIRVEILGEADRLIETAEADEAPTYALTTLDAARTARQRAADVLARNRYDRTESVKQAKRAEYEARHASNIARSVRSLNRNDQAWEKLMLLYEIQMNRLGQQMGLEYLPFDEGPIAATDSVLAFMAALQADAAGARAVTASADAVTQRLRQVLARLDADTGETDPRKLAEAIDARVAMLRAEWAATPAATGVAGAVPVVRPAGEDRFEQARRSLDPADGEVLRNADGDVVLRLRGLSVDGGATEGGDREVALLDKVAVILKTYPRATYVVEGHTDAGGEDFVNRQISERRAIALMQSLRQSLDLPSDRISAVGYGSDKPIASNQTPEGRAMNRRIDILIRQ